MLTPVVAAADEPVEAAAPAAVACVFRSLGDTTRLAILRHLTLGEHRVVELTAPLGLAQSTVSAVEEPHLRRLHGDPYAAYAARTGRFLPGVGRGTAGPAEARTG